jgi:hypothetical protein
MIIKILSVFAFFCFAVLMISMINCLLSGTIYQELKGDNNKLTIYSKAGADFNEFLNLNSRRKIFEEKTVEGKKGKYYEYSGVIHIHTTFSDGGGSYEEIGRVADELGLDFIIPSDHNYTGAMKDIPLRKSGHTLIVPAVEITPHQKFGHFLVMGDSIPPVPRGPVSPDSTYRTAVRMGDIIFIAHPFHSIKKDSWQNWSFQAFTGIELFNLDENWRKSLTFSKFNRILGGIVIFIFREDALNYLLSYPTEEMNKFDYLNKKNKVVGIGSSDAHSRLLVKHDLSVRYPSYRSMFKQVQNIIITRDKFNGIYVHDRELLLKALQRGNSFVAFSGIEDTKGFFFSAVSDTNEASLGDSLRVGPETKLKITIPNCDRSVVQIMKDGIMVGEYSKKNDIELTISDPGSYRVQVFQQRTMLPFFRKRSFPWILSNAIYLYK